MKYDFKNNKYFRWGLTAFLTIAASICFYYLLFHGNSIKAGFHTITGILMPVLYGLVTAYLLTPVLNYIETKLLFPLCRKLKVKEKKKEAVKQQNFEVAAAFRDKERQLLKQLEEDRMIIRIYYANLRLRGCMRKDFLFYH